MPRSIHPNSLANLKVITSENARAAQLKSAASKSLNHKMAEEFKISARAFQKALVDLPQVSSLDVLRMAMFKALQEDNFEDAARYANMIAEYENPKLARIEQTNTNKTVDLTDEELKKIISEEGLQEDNT
jgi:hypothetical protein